MKSTDLVVYDYVILADNYPIFASAMKRVINSFSSTVDTIEVTHFEEIFDQIEKRYTPSRPPLLLWDIRLPGGDGDLGLAELKSRFPDLPVVAIHDVIYHETSLRVLDQWLTGVICRQDHEEQLQRIMGHLLKGDGWFPERVHSPDALLPTEPVDQLVRLVQLESLSESQLRVMKRVLRGEMNKQIANELSVSESTVKVHISNMLKKFEVRSRSELIVSLLRPELTHRHDLLVK